MRGFISVSSGIFNTLQRDELLSREPMPSATSRWRLTFRRPPSQCLVVSEFYCPPLRQLGSIWIFRTQLIRWPVTVTRNGRRFSLIAPNSRYACRGQYGRRWVGWQAVAQRADGECLNQRQIDGRDQKKSLGLWG